MFPVKLFTFSKETNSTARPSAEGVTCKCISNDRLEVMAPILPLNIGSAENPTQYNYLYIPSFSRYYYIRNWAFVGGLWTASCEIDVLASWKTEIGATSAYVLRAAADFDEEIIDTLYPFKVKNYTFAATGLDATEYDLDMKTGKFVVGILGDGPPEYYAYTYNGVLQLFRYLLSDQYATQVMGALSITVDPGAKLSINPTQYIASVVWIPSKFTIHADSSYPSTIKVGFVDIPNGYSDMPDSHGYKVTGYTTTLTTHHTKRHVTRPDRPDYKWLDVAATSYKLFSPGFGTISIDPSIFYHASRIVTEITVNVISGDATLDVWAFMGNDDENFKITRVNGNIGLPIQLSGVVKPGVGVGNLISSIVPAAAAAATGNYAAAAVMATGAIGNLAGRQIPTVASVGGPPSLAALKGVETIYYHYLVPVSEDIQHRGRPLCQVRRLDTLPGYQLCTDTDLQLPATRAEIDAIRGYLEGGYYYN